MSVDKHTSKSTDKRISVDAEDIKERSHNIMSDVDRRMNSTIQNLRTSLSGLRTGRASAALLEPIKVEAYGDIVPLNQVSNISIPEPRTIVVNVWDRAILKSVEKAIIAAGLGLNPITDGASIRVPIPDLTQERRRELSNKARRYGEEAKVAIRNVRRYAITKFKEMKDAKIISEDMLERNISDIQKITDKHVIDIDDTIKRKTEEICG